MPAPSPLDLRRAIAATYKQSGMAQPSAAAVRYYESKGPNAIALLKANLAKTPRPAAAATPAAPLDPTQQFLEQIKSVLPKQAVAVTPFDQSGFYKEDDSRSLANSEYDPYYASLRTETDAANAEQDRQRKEEINAAGGFRSSAYGNENVLRKQALQRAAQQMADEQRGNKESFVTSRRNEAYQRYLQSVGANIQPA